MEQKKLALSNPCVSNRSTTSTSATRVHGCSAEQSNTPTTPSGLEPVPRNDSNTTSSIRTDWLPGGQGYGVWLLGQYLRVRWRGLVVGMEVVVMVVVVGGGWW